jgi:hypothetical protein
MAAAECAIARVAGHLALSSVSPLGSASTD